MAFKKFVEAHENDPLAGNAMYWLGETHYVRKDFMQAAQVFFQAYQKFPKGAKAPDSLLKLGMSMASMKKPAEACATFGKLRKEFGSDLKANIKGALDRETQRLACK
jgi:tol-pal system protein YbgF